MHDARKEPASIVLVAEDGSETVVWHLPEQAPDLALVDGLLRLKLHACRRGRRVRLRGTPSELRELLELAGLEDVLGLEPRRQPELREELGEDEVVQRHDPPA